MFRFLKRWSLISTVIASFLPALSGEESYWVYEGLITKADPKLAPDLQSGWVLSGSFVFDFLEMEEDIPAGATGAGRFSGGITDAEMTVDLYHQLHFEALQVPGMAGFDYQDNDPEANGRDLYGWFLPLRGKLKESNWTSKWLQIWLSDPEGNMIRSIPPRISPYGIQAKAAWFRLTLENQEGEPAYVDGSIQYFGPVDGRDEAMEEDWRSVASGLSRQLVERDSTIAELRDELAQSRARIQSLRRMVDLMVEERRTIEEENRLLAAQAQAVDPEIEVKISDLTADKALLEDEIESLTGKNQALAESLAESEMNRRRLMREMEDASLASMASPEEEQGVEHVVVTSPSGEEVGVMTIIEQPMIIEKPVYIEAPAFPVSSPEAISSSGAGFNAAKTNGSSSKKAKRRGPRKFR